MSFWSEFQKAAEKIYEAKDVDEYYSDAKYKILGNGTHVIIQSSLSPLIILWLDSRFGAGVEKKHPGKGWETGFGTWYRSKERVDGKYPFSGPITTKNWYGNEVDKINLADDDLLCM